MTSSTKPDVHSILHYRRKWTKPRPQVTCIQKSGEIRMCGFVDKRAYRQTNIQTYVQIRWLQYFAPLPGGEVNIFTFLQLKKNPRNISSSLFCITRVCCTSGRTSRWRSSLLQMFVELVAEKETGFATVQWARALRGGRYRCSAATVWCWLVTSFCRRSHSAGAHLLLLLLLGGFV